MTSATMSWFGDQSVPGVTVAAAQTGSSFTGRTVIDTVARLESEWPSATTNVKPSVPL